MQGKIETRVGLFVLVALAIFAYMGFQIGAFRFDKGNYALYTIPSGDIGDLSRKADVKIAGVKVGWVKEVRLVEVGRGEMQAEADVMVLKDYKLYDDAYAVVRQQGLLGPNYLEIMPGDPLLQTLESGSILGRPAKEPVSVDELLQKFKTIAENVQEVTTSFKEVLGGVAAQEQLKETFNNLYTTAERIASFSDVLEKTFARNEDNIDTFLEIGTDIRRLADRLDEDVFPAFQESIERISNVFDRDFNRIATKLESTTDTIEEASLQARDGLKNVSSIAEKIDDGKGTIGKLINEDDAYRDIKVAVQGLRNYFSKVDRLQLVFDSHWESFHRPAENYDHVEAKGYLDVRIHPNEDHFYVLQIASSEKGYVDRREIHKSYEDFEGKEVCLDDLQRELSERDKVKYTHREKFEIFNRNTYLLGLQFGKVFKDIALRFGLFEGLAGIGVDIDIPLKSDKFRWVMSGEVFDLAGWNRKDDKRPHLKWINRMYMFNSLYFTFGADDFASKRNANIFFGGGIRFGDDDVKFLLSSISGAGGLVGGSGGGGGSALVAGKTVV